MIARGAVNACLSGTENSGLPFDRIDPTADGEVIAIAMAMESKVHGIIRAMDAQCKPLKMF